MRAQSSSSTLPAHVAPPGLLASWLSWSPSIAGCGGGGGDNQDPVERVPANGGLREKVRAAQSPDASAFPAADGKTLQQVADGIGARAPSSRWRPRSSRPARTASRSG